MIDSILDNFRRIENKLFDQQKIIRVIRFYWAGKEVFPYLPTTSWVDCYESYELLPKSDFDCYKYFKEKNIDSKVR